MPLQHLPLRRSSLPMPFGCEAQSARGRQMRLARAEETESLVNTASFHRDFWFRGIPVDGDAERRGQLHLRDVLNGVPENRYPYRSTQVSTKAVLNLAKNMIKMITMNFEF